MSAAGWTTKRGREVVPGDRVHNGLRGGVKVFLVLNISDPMIVDGTGCMGRLAYNEWGERITLRQLNTYQVKEGKLT